jgi:hypothetical protein
MVVNRVRLGVWGVTKETEAAIRSPGFKAASRRVLDPLQRWQAPFSRASEIQ